MTEMSLNLVFYPQEEEPIIPAKNWNHPTITNSVLQLFGYKFTYRMSYYAVRRGRNPGIYNSWYMVLCSG